MSYFCIPYPFDIGSLNNPICGGKYVNIIKYILIFMSQSRIYSEYLSLIFGKTCNFY